jgi:hypothetical protein
MIDVKDSLLNIDQSYALQLLSHNRTILLAVSAKS